MPDLGRVGPIRSWGLVPGLRLGGGVAFQVEIDQATFDGASGFRPTGAESALCDSVDIHTHALKPSDISIISIA